MVHKLEHELTECRAERDEAAAQQAATSEILRVINSSPGDLTPVFTTIFDKALDLCEAAFGFVTTYDGERFERGVQRGVPDALAAYFSTGMDQPRPGDAHWRLLASEELIHNLDQKDEEAYRLGNPLRRAVVDLGGARSALVVALRKDNALLGALTVYRKEVRPFSEKQVAILQSFAAHAVIAIENARLLSELRKRTDEIGRWNRELEARVPAQVAEIERIGKLRRFLAPQLADLIIARGDESILESIAAKSWSCFVISAASPPLPNAQSQKRSWRCCVTTMLRWGRLWRVLRERWITIVAMESWCSSMIPCLRRNQLSALSRWR
jgi:GAF domain-containing protein